MEKIKVKDIINNEIMHNEYISAQLPRKYNSSHYNRYVNLMLKHRNLTCRLLYLNEFIDKYYLYWINLVKEPKIDTTNDNTLLQSTLKHKEWEHLLTNDYFKQEEFIMHLRKATDDCIVLFSIATESFNPHPKGKKPRPYEMIGELLKKNEIDKFPALKPHEPFLKTINAISNGFKHCVANSTTFKIGEFEPCIFVYANKDQFYNEIGVTINSLIVDFNNFYSTIDSIIKN